MIAFKCKGIKMFRITDGIKFATSLKHGNINMTKNGKVFMTLGALKAHIVAIVKYNSRKYDKKELDKYMEYDVINVSGEVLGKVKDFYKEKQ